MDDQKEQVNADLERQLRIPAIETVFSSNFSSLPRLHPSMSSVPLTATSTAATASFKGKGTAYTWSQACASPPQTDTMDFDDVDMASISSNSNIHQIYHIQPGSLDSGVIDGVSHARLNFLITNDQLETVRSFLGNSRHGHQVLQGVGVGWRLEKVPDVWGLMGWQHSGSEGQSGDTCGYMVLIGQPKGLSQVQS